MPIAAHQSPVEETDVAAAHVGLAPVGIAHKPRNFPRPQHEDSQRCRQPVAHKDESGIVACRVGVVYQGMFEAAGAQAYRRRALHLTQEAQRIPHVLHADVGEALGKRQHKTMLIAR